ncbi:MAG: tRNA lysidine(34) synthetase TilS, partial [Burkholderiaceae bacterium]
SAQAQAVLDEVAQLDLAAVADGNTLRIASWSLLSAARRANLLRHWLRLQAGRGAPESLVTRLLDEMPRSAEACWPFGEWTLRRHRGRLLFGEPHTPGPQVDPQARGEAGLQVTPVSHGGVATADLQGAEWRPRQGGERFQRHAGSPPRSLKKQFQDVDVPAWLRDVPLLYAADGRLLFVPGLGIDARALATPGQPQSALAWHA